MDRTRSSRLCIGAIALAACGGSNVEIHITFAGSPACPSNVDAVVVTDPTGSLPTTTLACSSSETIVKLPDVRAGSYALVVDGIQNDVTTWTGSTQIVAPGSGSFDVNLATPGGSLQIAVEFAALSTGPALTCDQAEVSQFTVTIDPGQPTMSESTVPCAAQLTVTGVPPGVHDIDVAAFDGQDNRIWDASVAQQDVTLGSPLEILANLQGVVPGPVGLSWTLPSDETCASAGVASVQYQLYASDGSMGMSGMIDCQTGVGMTATIATMVQAGEYSVTLQGCDASGNCDLLDSAGYPTPVGGIVVLPETLPSSVTTVALVSP